MKKLIAIFGLAVLMLSCGKDVAEVMVYRPCESVAFLQVGSDYYRICNVSELEGIADSTLIQVVYKEIDKCKGESVGECDSSIDIPESKSWVKIQYQI